MNISNVSLQSGSRKCGMCDIKLGKLVLWRVRGQIQADSKEVIHTLIKGNKFKAEAPEDRLLQHQ